ncbi:uncharacterized protein EI90DRAFT_80126 [Cantharellus anzutake]|uniref:uncharacterized protein n=1 Tax=Cantharellus anzutake TaxID=1750568 RepID=UPI001902F992|nr:uncharacterized protein EI90DRAFT_80126 [Cantharellus anzutake]KAF8336874.1 hypothetical protein EI90DRAFT_80126 [Cantharellus anzutake]
MHIPRFLPQCTLTTLLSSKPWITRSIHSCGSLDAESHTAISTLHPTHAWMKSENGQYAPRAFSDASRSCLDLRLTFLGWKLLCSFLIFETASGSCYKPANGGDRHQFLLFFYAGTTHRTTHERDIAARPAGDGNWSCTTNIIIPRIRHILSWNELNNNAENAIISCISPSAFHAIKSVWKGMWDCTELARRTSEFKAE